jgi:ribosomal protein S18 acetylase RimI-like enzyme
MPVLNFVIRDGLDADIEACLALDHAYQTDQVWQMNFTPEGNGYRTVFRQERLPREVDLHYHVPEERLRTAAGSGGLLVAMNKEDETVLGYCALRHDTLNHLVAVRDIVVTRPLQRRGVGTRLFAVARRWASEKKARFLLAEVQTKNVPAILFLQRQGLEYCGFNDRYFPDHDIAVFFGQAL